MAQAQGSSGPYRRPALVAAIAGKTRGWPALTAALVGGAGDGRGDGIAAQAVGRGGAMKVRVHGYDMAALPGINLRLGNRQGGRVEAQLTITVVKSIGRRRMRRHQRRCDPRSRILRRLLPAASRKRVASQQRDAQATSSKHPTSPALLPASWHRASPPYVISPQST